MQEYQIIEDINFFKTQGHVDEVYEGFEDFIETAWGNCIESAALEFARSYYNPRGKFKVVLYVAPVGEKDLSKFKPVRVEAKLEINLTVELLEE